MTIRRLVLLAVVSSFLVRPAFAERTRAAQTQPPVVANQPPARFVLSGGNVIVGRKIGEDAESYTVQTDSGVVQVRKSAVVSIDFGGAPAPVPLALQDRAEPERSRKKNAGKSLFVAGLITFGSIYVLTFIGGLVVSFLDEDGVWMYVPVMGPVLYYINGDVNEAALAPFIMITVFQGIGVLVAMAGAIAWGASSGGDEARRPSRFADRVRLSPLVGPDLGGAALSLSF